MKAQRQQHEKANPRLAKAVARDEGRSRCAPRGGQAPLQGVAASCRGLLQGVAARCSYQATRPGLLQGAAASCQAARLPGLLQRLRAQMPSLGCLVQAPPQLAMEFKPLCTHFLFTGHQLASCPANLLTH